MNRKLVLLFILGSMLLQQCKVVRELQITSPPKFTGKEGLVQICSSADTIHSILISKADALLTFDDERYEVQVTLYSKKDSIIYLSAVNSGYEIIRASVEKDTIKVINRLNKVVYRSPLMRRFGYQYPVNFEDFQNILSRYYLCDDLVLAGDKQNEDILFEFDDELVKKRIVLESNHLDMKTFEFFHQRTNQYLMGERIDKGFKIYSNFMITDFEIIASGGEITYNREVEVKMEVNPRRYTYTEMR